MERLQEALQKARTQRSGKERRPAEAAAPSDTATLWQELTPFEPDPKLLERNRIVANRATKMGAPFDILRTKILLTMRKNNWTRLAITSPTPGCGKTTTACNLALGFARQTDVRTCLFELDLRKPSIARSLALPGGGDIADMLAGDIPFADQALCYRGNVAISAVHQPSRDPTVVMLSRTTHKTLEAIEKAYAPDLTLFDLPPLLVSDDARAFLKEVDCALMVAQAEKTTVAQIDECEREIAEHCNVLGVVLNHCRHTDEVYGAYGSYETG